MSLKHLVENYLESQPLFRERKNKDRGIVNILISRHFKLGEAIRQGLLSKGQVTEIMQEYATMDRAWRQALEQHEELRGKDYDEKVRLEQEKQIQLGYTPGHAGDIKKLATLS
jgi:seryl-tRNA synthetase